MDERRPITFPGFEGRKLEVVTRAPIVPESPLSEACLIDLALSYQIPDFLITRFTVTRFEQGGDIFEGTVEGLNTSVDKPVLVWWKGNKNEEDGDETRGIEPQHPIFYSDEMPLLTLSQEFDNITLVLALAAWFSLEDGASGVIVPSLKRIREVISDLSTP